MQLFFKAPMSIVQGSYTHRVGGSVLGFMNCSHHLLVSQWPSHVSIIFIKNTGIWSIYLSFCSTYVYTMKIVSLFFTLLVHVQQNVH